MPHDHNLRHRPMTSHTNGAASAPNTLPDATLANPKLAVPAAVADAPAPPLIVVKSPSDAPDAGLRSLDHCTLLHSPNLAFLAIAHVLSLAH